MKIILIPLMISILFLTGCQGFKDIDKRFFVLVIAVDKPKETNHTYRVTLKMGITSSKIQPGSAKEQIVSQDANSIPEAIQAIKSKVDKEIDFGHAKILLIGESLAKEDITQTVDFFIRRRDIQGVAFMAVASPDAETIIKIHPASERIPGDALNLSFDKTGTESSFIISEYLFDFYRRMTELGLDPYLPIIKPLKDTYSINQVGIFDKSKMKVTLSKSETRILNEMIRKFKKFDETVKSKNNNFTISVEDFTRKLYFDPHDDKNVQLNISLKGVLEQSKQPLFNNDWSTYEKETQNVFAAQFLELLQKLQKYNVDPIGLGLLYRAHHYAGTKDWSNWQKIYPKISFKSKVQVKIEGTGVIK